MDREHAKPRQSMYHGAMSWETACRLLRAQGIEPTVRDRRLFDQGFRSHILFPKKDKS